MRIYPIANHSTLPDMPSGTIDDHTLYPLVDGTRGFTGVVDGISPTDSAHLATKGYVDSQNEVFGSLFVAEATPVTVDIITQGVQAIVTSGSNTPVVGFVNGMTFQNNQELKIATAGKYLTAWHMSFTRASGGVAREAEGGVGISGTFSDICSAHRVIGAGNDVGNMSGVCIHNLSVDDTISLMIANEGGTEDIIVEHAGLTLKLLDDQSATFTMDHGNLTGLTDIADHPYALLINGGRELTADWDAGAFNITSKNSVSVALLDFTAAETQTIFNSNAPYNLEVIDVWAINRNTSQSTYDVSDGTDMIATGVLAASAQFAIQRTATIDTTKSLIALNGTLDVTVATKGTVSCFVMVMYRKAL